MPSRETALFTDEFTGSILRKFKGVDLSSHYKRIGSGEGLHDAPAKLALFSVIDPGDVRQQSLGDCWLLGSISAVAEFRGLISNLFKERELSPRGEYTVFLFDLVSLSWKTYTIDNRLQTHPHNPSLLRFADLSPEGEIWCPLLEKAFAVHAGGWDQINGGDSAVALACLTGCTDTVVIANMSTTLNPSHFKYSMKQYDWETFRGNSSKQAGRLLAHSGFNGQFGDASPDVLFDHLCEWDKKNFIMTAGTGGPNHPGNDDKSKDGIVDKHVYSVIAVKKQVCGKFDLLCFRCPSCCACTHTHTHTHVRMLFVELCVLTA